MFWALLHLSAETIDRENVWHCNVECWQFQVYWEIVLQELSLKFLENPRCILDTSDQSKYGGKWLPGAVLNISECCLLPIKRADDSVAIVWRDEGDDSSINSLSLKELRDQVMYALAAH